PSAATRRGLLDSKSWLTTARTGRRSPSAHGLQLRSPLPIVTATSPPSLKHSPGHHLRSPLSHHSPSASSASPLSPLASHSAAAAAAAVYGANNAFLHHKGRSASQTPTLGFRQKRRA